jgi:hypothetical protein
VPVAEHGEEHPDGASVLEPRVLGDVDAALLPAARGFAQRRRCGRLGRDTEVGDSLRSEFASDPAGADRASRLVGNEPP